MRFGHPVEERAEVIFAIAVLGEVDPPPRPVGLVDEVAGGDAGLLVALPSRSRRVSRRSSLLGNGPAPKRRSRTSGRRAGIEPLDEALAGFVFLEALVEFLADVEGEAGVLPSGPECIQCS